jgi:hypothetical protein
VLVIFNDRDCIIKQDLEKLLKKYNSPFLQPETVIRYETKDFGSSLDINKPTPINTVCKLQKKNHENQKNCNS